MTSNQFNQALTHITTPPNNTPIPNYLNIHNYPWDTTDPEQLTMRDETNRIIHNIITSSTPKWLTLLGKSGIGKTYLATAILNITKKSLPKKNIQLWHWNTIVNDHLRQGNYDIMHWLRSLHTLVIDDIGALTETTFATTKLYELLDARLDKYTIITSNLTPTEISKQLDTRIASRLFRNGSQVLLLKNLTDYPLKQWINKQSH